MKYMKSEDAAEYIGAAPGTMMSSRSTGVLLGRIAPKHIKVGRSVRYRRATLNKWLSQFKEQTVAFKIRGTHE